MYNRSMADPFAVHAEPEVVASDGSILVVTKPPRMHSAPGRSPDSLCSWVFERFPEAAGVGNAGEEDPAPRGSRLPTEGGLLHRLDYETSGLVLFARSAEAFAFLLREQREGRIRKEYLLRAAPSRECHPAGSRPPRSRPMGLDEAAWSEAIAAEDSGRIALLLGGETRPDVCVESLFRPYGPGAARVACLDPAESTASVRRLPGPYITHILEARDSEGVLELLAAIDLGFRHQIRAHVAWIGLPILGDPLYGGRPAARLYLHASRLTFRHPVTGLETIVETG